MGPATIGDHHAQAGLVVRPSVSPRLEGRAGGGESSAGPPGDWLPRHPKAQKRAISVVGSNTRAWCSRICRAYRLSNGQGGRSLSSEPAPRCPVWHGPGFQPQKRRSFSAFSSRVPAVDTGTQLMATLQTRPTQKQQPGPSQCRQRQMWIGASADSLRPRSADVRRDSSGRIPWISERQHYGQQQGKDLRFVPGLVQYHVSARTNCNTSRARGLGHAEMNRRGDLHRSIPAWM